MAEFDIEKFLLEERNLELYEKYISQRELFHNDFPLEKLLEIVVNNVSYIKGNREKPRAVSLKIKDVAESLPIKPRQEFYVGLIEMLCSEYDESLNPCIRLINLDYKNRGKDFDELVPSGYIPIKTADMYLKEYKKYKNGEKFYFDEYGNRNANSWAESKLLKDREQEQRQLNEASSVLMSNAVEGSVLMETYKDELTLRQKAIFFYYLQLYYKIGKKVSLSVFATVVAKLLDKKVPGKISDTNLYKFLGNPELKRTQDKRSILLGVKDLEVVKDLCSAIGENEIGKLINMDIKRLENGME